jgi:hypothetical protein
MHSAVSALSVVRPPSLWRETKKADHKPWLCQGTVGDCFVDDMYLLRHYDARKR